MYLILSFVKWPDDGQLTETCYQDKKMNYIFVFD